MSVFCKMDISQIDCLETDCWIPVLITVRHPMIAAQGVKAPTARRQKASMARGWCWEAVWRRPRLRDGGGRDWGKNRRCQRAVRTAQPRNGQHRPRTGSYKRRNGRPGGRPGEYAGEGAAWRAARCEPGRNGRPGGWPGEYRGETGGLEGGQVSTGGGGGERNGRPGEQPGEYWGEGE